MIDGGEMKVNIIRGSYKIVSSQMPLRLEGDVNRLMREGYLPCGNLVIDRGLYLQPMIKTHIEEVRE